jgi:HAD superfamily hydrolase (TIGR01450 family)
VQEAYIAEIDMIIKDDIFSISEMYDVFFVDVYGVLYDGVKLYDNTLYTLKTLKNSGKKIVILSNTTQIASDAKTGYSQRGMQEGIHYDEVVTSGEYLRQTIINHEFSKIIGTADIQFVKYLFMGNNAVFADTDITETDSYDEADFIYVGMPRASYGSIRIDNLFYEDNKRINIEDVIDSDWKAIKDSQGRNGLSEFAHFLEICLKKNKILLVANPDIFAHSSMDNNSKKAPILTQGCIGKYYEKLGGKVIYFGKPYAGIFENAKQYVKSTDRVAMVGDTPWTDVLGANTSCIDSVLVTTGVSGEFFEKMQNSASEDEKFESLFNKIAKKMNNITNESIVPTHIIKQFAKIAL